MKARVRTKTVRKPTEVVVMITGMCNVVLPAKLTTSGQITPAVLS